jgi:hypothetical protein
VPELHSKFGGCVVPAAEFIETVTGWDTTSTVAGPTGELLSTDIDDDTGWTPTPQRDQG